MKQKGISAHSEIILPASAKQKRMSFLSVLGLSALFFFFALWTFYLPMVRAFWHGADDSGLIGLQDLAAGMDFFDNAQNRPMIMVPYVLASALTPDSVDAYLWQVLAFRLATAALLCMVLREVYRTQSYTVSVLAALLFIINPSDTSRYIAIVMNAYYFGVMLLLAAFWLYLRSYRLQSRLILVVSCFLATLALLTYESGFPLAIHIPIFLTLYLRPA